MVFDKEFVSHLTNYIGSNDFTSKKYLNAYYIKFLDILKVHDDKKQIINVGYRFWNFRDYDILNFIYGKPIEVKSAGFSSYYSNISNTNKMIEFLEIDNKQKLFYLIEERRDDLIRIYTPLEYIDKEEYNEEELKIINETLEKYRVENEYIALKHSGYELNFKNVKAFLMHERLSDLLDLKDIHKFKNGYCYVPLNKENIYIMKTSDVFAHLVEKKFKLNDFGCIVLDKFYDDSFMDRFESIEEEKVIVEEIDITKPRKITFKPSN